MITKATAGVLAVLVLAAGCNHDPNPSTTVTPGLSLPSKSSCPKDHATAVPLIPETQAEVRLLPTLTMCTNSGGTSTLLLNDDDAAVWIIDQPTGLRWTEQHSDPVVATFREAVSQVALTGLPLEPGQQIRVAVPPGRVHLSLNPRVQAGWQALTSVSDTVKDKALDRFQSYLAKGSSVRNAALTCFRAGYNVGDELPGIIENSELANRIEKGMGLLGDTTGCVRAIRVAGQDTPITVEAVRTTMKGSSWRTTTTRILGAAKLLPRVGG